MEETKEGRARGVERNVSFPSLLRFAVSPPPRHQRDGRERVGVTRSRGPPGKFEQSSGSGMVGYNADFHVSPSTRSLLVPSFPHSPLPPSCRRRRPCSFCCCLRRTNAFGTDCRHGTNLFSLPAVSLSLTNHNFHRGTRGQRRHHRALTV